MINQRCAVVGQGPMGLIFTHLLGRMGAAQVIAIETVGWRLSWARRFGATDLVDASKENVVEAVRELTGGRMIDFCVEAVGHADALCTAARLPRRQGRLYVFGVPHVETQEFPWFHTVSNETELITSMGPECMDYFQTAVDMIVQGRVEPGSHGDAATAFRQSRGRVRNVRRSREIGRLAEVDLGFLRGGVKNER